MAMNRLAESFIRCQLHGRDFFPLWNTLGPGVVPTSPIHTSEIWLTSWVDAWHGWHDNRMRASEDVTDLPHPNHFIKDVRASYDRRMVDHHHLCRGLSPRPGT